MNGSENKKKKKKEPQFLLNQMYPSADPRPGARRGVPTVLQVITRGMPCFHINRLEGEAPGPGQNHVSGTGEDVNFLCL